MNDTHIRFVSGPGPIQRKRDWVAIAEALRARPGEWAMLFEVGAMNSSVVTDGRRALGADYEVCSRRPSRYARTRTVFGRFVG